jgi:hypothetical protein
MKAVMVNLQEVLSVEEYEQLIEALKSFSQNTVNQTSSEQSDPVMVSLTFNGQGENSPKSAEQQFLLAFAENIFTRITP